MPTNNSATSMQAVQRGAGANMSVDISIGVCAMPNTSGTYSYIGFTDAVANQTISAADPTNPRIDVVVAYVDLSVVSSSSNNNPGALKFADVTGTPAGSPSAPSSGTIQTAVGAGNPWTYIAQISVAANATQIVTANITDTRLPWAVRANLWGGASNTKGHTVPNVADDTVALLAATQTFTNKTFTSPTINTPSMAGYTGWQTPSGTFTYAGNNGSKEFLINTSVNLTSVLSKGAKIQVTRNTTPPTQAMSFTAASSQYATKASPAGITFTSTYTQETWLYLNSYPSSSSQYTLLARTDVAQNNGFKFAVLNTGQIVVQTLSGGTANHYWSTYQSVPLKRWVHIAVSINLANSATAPVFYLNGQSIPYSQQTNAGAYTLTQTGNLVVGASSVPSEYLDGYMAEVRLWSAVQSQAQIQANMAINCVGNETNLVALYQGPTFNDLTANANNLTATNGATQVTAYPYNAIEYGIVTNITSSQLTVFTGTDYTIPNMTLNSPAYSFERSPFGFAAGKTKWRVDSLLLTTQTTTSNANYGSFISGGYALTVPTGSWTVGMIASGYNPTTTQVVFNMSPVSLTGQSATAGFSLSPLAFSMQSPSAAATFTNATVTTPADLASATTYTVQTVGATASAALQGNVNQNLLFAECAYV